ncbi:hypothetical protein [Psychromicrobium sp. YIM B11713]|uniref:hypothetical protein n=1 Tax=Psychromicrobium sp. YIM B11713 TaxID=3145233 RepID=UPI00374E3555
MKSIKGRAIAVATAAVIAGGAMIFPATSAQATNWTACNEPGLVELVRDSGRKDCLANRGDITFGSLPTDRYWVRSIASGNNDINWASMDQKWNFLPRWYIIDFPTVGTVQLYGIRIL